MSKDRIVSSKVEANSMFVRSIGPHAWNAGFPVNSVQPTPGLGIDGNYILGGSSWAVLVVNGL